MATYRIQPINQDDLETMLRESPERVVLAPCERQSLARLFGIRNNFVRLRSGRKIISDASLRWIDENLIDIQSPPYSLFHLQNAAFWVFQQSGLVKNLREYTRLEGFVYPPGEDYSGEVYSFSEVETSNNESEYLTEKEFTETDDDEDTETEDVETENDEDAETEDDEDAETENDEDTFFCEGCGNVRHIDDYRGAMSLENGVVIRACDRCMEPDEELEFDDGFFW